MTCNCCMHHFGYICVHDHVLFAKPEQATISALVGKGVAVFLFLLCCPFLSWHVMFPCLNRLALLLV